MVDKIILWHGGEYMNELLIQIGNRIYERRKQLRLTQEELAERADVSTQTVSTAELGKKALRPENIVKICAALEISTDYLLLGKVTETDHSLLSGKVSKLNSGQYHYLEDIINSYLAAIQGKKT